MNAAPQAIGTLFDRYFAAQLVGDRRAALRAVVDDGLRANLAVPDLYIGVIQAAQRRIGELWQQNRISVAQEHIATAISELAVAELYTAMEFAPSNGRAALVACVGGELHDLGSRMTADFFEMAGFDVRYLGASVPTDSLIPAVRDYAPDLLVLSVTMSFHAESLRRSVVGLREALGDSLRLAVGGHAFVWQPELVQQVSADVYGRDAPESVQMSQRLLGLTPT